MPPSICVVAPVFNEVAGILEFVERVVAVLERLPRAQEHRVVVVDDGSSDGTTEALEALARSEPRLKVVFLSRNFGHQAAVTAGLDHSEGDVVVVMDSDLQDDPETIIRFLELHAEGYDVVYAVRTRRKEPLWLRVAYALHYRLTSRISRPRLPQDAGDFSLMTRRIVDHVNALPERQRYVRGLRAWTGFRQIGIEVERSARLAGDSKYSIGRLFNLAFDGIFAFSVVPIRVAFVAGILAVLASLLYVAYAAVVRITSGAVPAGFTGLLVVTAFLSGTVLVFLGVVGEYVGRIYEEVKGRPSYIVKSVIGPRSRDG